MSKGNLMMIGAFVTLYSIGFKGDDLLSDESKLLSTLNITLYGIFGMLCLIFLTNDKNK